MAIQLATQIIIALSAIITSMLLLRSTLVAMKRKRLAMEGDIEAAKLILLPCYGPLFRGLIALFLIGSIIVLASIGIKDPIIHLAINEYYFFCMLLCYSIVPVALIQKSVSYRNLWRIFYIIFPWWVVSTLLFSIWFGLASNNYSDEQVIPFQILFYLIEILPPLLLSIGILTQTITSRVQLGSNSNRNMVELLLVASVIQTIFNVILIIITTNSDYHDEKIPFLYFLQALLFSLENFVFPFAMYRTLHADTKFWRGLGKHNQGGIRFSEMVRTGDISAPTIDLHIVSSSFQDMITDLGNVVDFAFLQVDSKIGDGATAEVYQGKFKQHYVAIKIYSPPEVTLEVIQEFAKEAKACEQFSHKNIVKFFGICVRPPQIGMVFELCDSSLKTLLKSKPELWGEETKLFATLQVSRALAYVHRKGYIHRDIKTDNFFIQVSNSSSSSNCNQKKGSSSSSSSSSFFSNDSLFFYRFLVKLGDFGEVTEMTNDPNRKMTILGTVAYMAPELIAGKKQYNQSIDCYAVGMSFWELWSEKEPFSDRTTFQIYADVAQGIRPLIPEGMSSPMKDIVTQCWLEEPSKRPTASEMIKTIKGHLKKRLRALSTSTSTPTFPPPPPPSPSSPPSPTSFPSSPPSPPSASPPPSPSSSPTISSKTFTSNPIHTSSKPEDLEWGVGGVGVGVGQSRPNSIFMTSTSSKGSKKNVVELFPLDEAINEILYDEDEGDEMDEKVRISSDASSPSFSTSSTSFSTASMSFSTSSSSSFSSSSSPTSSPSTTLSFLSNFRSGFPMGIQMKTISSNSNPSPIDVSL